MNPRVRLRRSRGRSSYRVMTALLCGLADGLAAQSDPGGFVTVIDVPPSVIGDFEALEPDTQVNVFDGGQIGVLFGSNYNHDPDANVEINVYGGTIGEGFGVVGQGRVNLFGGFIDLSANFDSGVAVRMTGGTVDTNLTVAGFDAPTLMVVEGGSIGAFLDIDQGATLHYSGGSIGDKLEVFSGGRLDIFGSAFFIDGQPLEGLLPGEPFEVTQRGGAVLSGVLADGSPFAFDLNATPPPDAPLADVFYGSAVLTVTPVLPERLFSDGFEAQSLGRPDPTPAFPAAPPPVLPSSGPPVLPFTRSPVHPFSLLLDRDSSTVRHPARDPRRAARLK